MVVWWWLFLTWPQDGWREVIVAAVRLGVPTPCFSTALSFYDGYRCKKLPANFIQAQRDYFGAHTYELLDKPGRPTSSPFQACRHRNYCKHFQIYKNFVFFFSFSI